MLFSAFLAACAGVPAASPPIMVTGEGPTFEQAKDNAFKQAIEIQVGLILLSEREVSNLKLVRNEILTYSSGYVEDFKIISQGNSNGKVTVTMDVVVASSKLANRVITVSKTQDVIDGNRLSTQHKTFMDNKQQGDVLLNKVLSSYPSQAFNLVQRPTGFFLDNYRQMIMNVPYEISWNYNYIVAFNEAMGILDDGDNGFLQGSHGSVITMVKPLSAMFIGDKKSFKFNDLMRTNQIANSMRDQNEMRVYWALKDLHGKTAAEGCVISQQQAGYTKDRYNRTNPFYTAGAKQTVIYGNVVEKDSINIEVYRHPTLMKVIEQDFRVEMSVVPLRNCPA